jgi:hypothetical protein
MTSTYDILLLGPAGPERQRLGALLGELGHRVVAEARPPEAARRYDLAVLDLRAGAPAPELAHLEPDLPLLAVASEPGPALRALRGRLSMVLTGAERPSGYQVALAVCAALGRRGALAGSLVA